MRKPGEAIQYDKARVRELLKSMAQSHDLENVRIDREIVSMVRQYKKKHFMPVGRFFAIAALEKLLKERV